MEVIGSVSSSIVRLNERAVEQLCAEAYDQAQATLKAALTLFRRGLAAQDTLALEESGEEVKEEKEDGGDDDSEADRTGSNEWEAKALELVTASVPPDPVDDPPVGDVGVSLVSLGVSHPPYTTTPNADHRTSSYYLINMAMVFACEGREDEENLGDDVILFASSRNSARTTAVLCYNLAMTYHLRALAMSHGSHHPQRAPHLNKALRVYDLVLNPTGLLDVGGSRLRHRRVDASSIRIRAALYNNKGHAHHCLRETDRVKACVRALSLWAIDDEDEDAEEQHDEERDGAGGGASIAQALGDAALPVALNVHLHSRGQNIHPASSA
jgi:hypothetical protein